MEEPGVIPPDRQDQIPELCRSLIETAALLVAGLDHVGPEVVHELQLLTLGPQFRGSRNTDLGKAAVDSVFALIKELIRPD